MSDAWQNTAPTCKTHSTILCQDIGKLHQNLLLNAHKRRSETPSKKHWNSEMRNNFGFGRTTKFSAESIFDRNYQNIIWKNVSARRSESSGIRWE